MMNDLKLLNSPIKFFWAGVAFVVLGFALPLLIVLGVIENSFFLSFSIFVMQLVGFILGVIAAAGMALKRRRKKEIKDRTEKEDDHRSYPGWME